MLGVLTFIGLLTAGVGAGVLHDRRKKVAVWRDVAERLGLELRGAKLGETIGMGGELEGCAIDAEYASAQRKTFMTVRLTTPGLPFYAVWQQRTQLFARERGAETGDELFDDHYVLHGHEVTLTTALSARARQEMLALEVSMQGSVLHLSFGAADGAELIAAHTRRAVALAKALHLELASLPMKLAATLAGETWSAPRKKQLLLLLSLNDAAEPLKEEALARALDDVSDPERRFIAAKRLGERGAAAMRAIAFDRDAGGELRVRAALSLAPADQLDVERALIEVLADDDPDAQRAAAHALEKVGTVAAVEPLRAAAQGMFTSLRLKHAVGGAIGAIQSRPHGAEEGGLSLAPEAETGGALSVAPAEVGALSIEKD